ncbi:hypothetical protein ACMBCM_06655 [Spiroplasma sp. K1]
MLLNLILLLLLLLFFFFFDNLAIENWVQGVVSKFQSKRPPSFLYIYIYF